MPEKQENNAQKTQENIAREGHENFLPELSPSLFIALGSTGLDILSKFQELVLEHYGRPSLDIFSYIAIETDQKAQAKTLDWGSNEIRLLKPVIRSTDAIRRSLSEGHKEYLREWLNPNLLKIAGGQFTEGAANIRMAGRLILWENWDEISRVLSEAHDSIKSDVNIERTEKYLQNRYGRYGVATDEKKPIVDARMPNVYVLGTLCGGSCSGMFLDIAYYIKEISGLYAKNLPNPNMAKLIGIFTGFDAATLKQAQQESVKGHAANTWAALKEYDFYYGLETRYRTEFPNGRKLDTNEPPLDWLYFLSCSATNPNNQIQSNFRKGAHPDMDSLNHMAAMVAFTETVGGLASLKGSVRTDYRSRARALKQNTSQHSPCIASCGIAAVWYPRYRIALGATCVYGINLCKKWLSKPDLDEEAVLRRQTNENWEELFARNVDTLITESNALMTDMLVQDLTKEKKRFLKLPEFEFSEVLEERLQQINKGGRYETIINNPERKARFKKSLAEGLHSLIRNMIDQAHSVASAQFVLSELDKAISEKIDFLPESFPVPNLERFQDFEVDWFGKLVFRNSTLIHEYKSDAITDLIRYMESQIKHIRNWVAVEVLELVRRELGVGKGYGDVEKKAKRLTIKEHLERAHLSVRDCMKSLDSREREVRSKVRETQDVKVVCKGEGNDISIDIDQLAAKLALLDQEEAESLEKDISGNKHLSDFLGFGTPDSRAQEIKESILENVSGYLLRNRQDFDVLGHVMENWRPADLAGFAKHALPHLELTPGHSNLASTEVGRPISFVSGRNSEVLNGLLTQRLKGTEIDGVFGPNQKSPNANSEIPHMLLFYSEEPLMYMDENMVTAHLFEQYYRENPGLYGLHTHKGGESVFDPKVFARIDETRNILMPVAMNILSERDGDVWVKSDIFSIVKGELVFQGKRKTGIDYWLSSGEAGVETCGEEAYIFEQFKKLVEEKIGKMTKEQVIKRLGTYVNWVKCEAEKKEGANPVREMTEEQNRMLKIEIVARKVGHEGEN